MRVTRRLKADAAVDAKAAAIDAANAQAESAARALERLEHGTATLEPKANLRKHLKRRGMDTKGSHDQLLERLLEQVWAELLAHQAEQMDSAARAAEKAAWEEEQAQLVEVLKEREQAIEKLRSLKAEFADMTRLCGRADGGILRKRCIIQQRGHVEWRRKCLNIALVYTKVQRFFIP